MSWDDLPNVEHPTFACREVERAALCRNLYNPIGSLDKHLIAIANGCIHFRHPTVIANLLEMVNQGSLVLVGSRLTSTVKNPLIRWQPDPVSDPSKNKSQSNGKWVANDSLNSQMRDRAQSLISNALLLRSVSYGRPPTPWPERAEGLDDIPLPPPASGFSETAQPAGKAAQPDTHWLEFDYFDQTGNLTNVVEYEITQAGNTFTGNTSNGTLKLINGVKNAPYDVEFEPTATREMETIRRELKKELDASIAQHKKEQSYKAAALEQSPWWEVPFIYGGAVGHGVVQYVDDTAQAGAELVTGFVKRKVVATEWLVRYGKNHAEAFEAFQDEDPERLQKEVNDIEAMHDEVGEAVSDMKENARILSLIMLDPQCRLMMQDFAEQYGDALIGPEKARFLARHGTDILLMAAAGLGAGIIYLKNAARISAWLKKAAKLIEQGRLANAAKFKGLKVKEKQTLQQPKTKIDGGKKGNWSKELNNPKPNTEYLSNGYTYKTDNLGRVNNVKGGLKLKTADRNTYQQSKAGKSGNKGDEGGHQIASIFNGPGEKINLLPMNSNLNKGAWKKMENKWADELKAGKKVEVNITPEYIGNNTRPSKFIVEYKVDGKVHQRFFNNSSGG